MAGHKVNIEIEVPEGTPEGKPITWTDVRELIDWNTPFDGVAVKPLSGDIHSRGVAGLISITVRELHG